MSDFSLDTVSVLLIWTAIAIYALAFVAYTIDLSRRGAEAASRKGDRARELVGVGAVGRTSIDQMRIEQQHAATALTARGTQRDRPLWARIGTSLTWLGFIFHVGADVTRGIDAGRVPWSNMYEFSMTGTMLIVGVYLVVLFRYDLRFLGSFVTGLITLLMGGAMMLRVDVTPLSDPLKSPWLVIHVFVASLATALYALAFALSVLQLMQSRRERKALAAAEDPDAAPPRMGPTFLRILPSSDALESLAYRFAIIGFIFWSFTLIAGSIWANDAWGRYWGFDTKEVWTFVIWVVYAGYIHARATRGWRGTRSAWLSIIGFASVMFNFTIVNLFFKGLHVYSGIE